MRLRSNTKNKINRNSNSNIDRNVRHSTKEVKKENLTHKINRAINGKCRCFSLRRVVNTYRNYGLPKFCFLEHSFYSCTSNKETFEQVASKPCANYCIPNQELQRPSQSLRGWLSSLLTKDKDGWILLDFYKAFKSR
ncbi:hypothetical protein BD770DRAFT_239714 [Pilaira anomala]|nr:hypothetical protein BD770DRAFT_239714 [Pilaira anomala]